MASIREIKNRSGKTRWRVYAQLKGSKGHSEHRTYEEACHRLYLAESHKLQNTTPQQFFSLQDFTLQKAVHFYLGSQWEKVTSKKLAEETFRKAASELSAADVDLLSMRAGKVTEILIRQYARPGCFIWLRAVFALLADLNLIKNNPAPRPQKRTRKLILIPLQEEVQRLFCATDDPCIRMFVFLCSSCGLRTSEALALKRDDIYGNRIIVRRHLTPGGVVEGTKRNPGREIRVPSEFFTLLSMLDERAEYLIYDDKKLNAPVKLQSFRAHRMRPLYVSLGLSFSNHALRHFAAANWIGEGRDLITVQRLLGHKDIAVTMAYYGHLINEPETVKSYVRI
jgi:integrase